MAKLKPRPIGESDLTEYLNTQSDFAFELTVLKTLLGHDFTCEHGGSYDDPVTQKPREFDLRATKTIGHSRIRLAVECKNLRHNFPLLISCVPRRFVEAFHEVALSFAPTSDGFTPPAFQERAKAVRLTGGDSIYKPNELVGKSSAQVGRQSDGTVVASDSDVYAKWAQAISSAQELTDRACYDGERDELRAYLSAVFPILVVPDGTLWLAEFDANGSRIGTPRPVDRCSYFIDKFYVGGDKLHGFSYQISHLEFVTLAGLVKIIGDLFSEHTVRIVFPADQIRDKLA